MARVTEWLEAEGFELCLGMVYGILEKIKEEHPESVSVDVLKKRIEEEAKSYL